MINIFFLIVYLIFSGSLSAVEIYYILSVQCVLLIFAYLRRHPLKITPLLIYYVSIILVNYANVQLIDQVGTGDLQVSFLIPKYINEAAEIWCISSTLTIMGYEWANKRSMPSIGFEIKKERILRIIFWVLLILNLFGSSINLRGGVVLKSVGLLNYIAVLFYARIWAKENNTRYRTYTLILYVLETYIALKTAFLRFDLIWPTGCLFLGYFIGKGNIKYLFTYRIIPFIIIFSFYSSVFKSLQENRSNFGSVIFNENNMKEADQKKNSGALVARSSNIAQMTNVVKLVKENGFYDGKVSAPLLTALIPRFLWPEKPKIALGQWFALVITSDVKNPSGTSTNSINMTLPGELYLDFGWLGVVIGSFLFGVFIPNLWNAARFYSSEYNLAGTIFGGYLLMLAMAGFAADLQIVITLLSSYLGFFIIKKLVIKRPEVADI